MDFNALVKERYSCKKYDGRAIAKEQLESILEAGRLAPTAKNLQGQHIYVLQSAEIFEKLDMVTPCRYNAPTVLAVTYDENNMFTYPGGKYNSGAEDSAIVGTHLMLAAKAVGVDSCWVNFFDPDVLAEALGLPENEKAALLLDLGYPAEGAGPLENHSKRVDLESKVTYL